ncbi:Six-hairpin glycosidase-like protein [Boeremia exigua]|uniref:Six-hairpin glycosidase-like protein n=1 Tax=Boeremia exigua TaxID=749465 RepID=UPI001E8E7E29|nr:Six-hairpin glycosidase-like protein [Boeremia exigua]KAH6633007.1 Six-hairpin glycosidase-like protein [Boeremia exigua]
MLPSYSYGFALLFLPSVVEGAINRKSIVQRFNLRLNQSHPYSPVQVGNGNFAFGVDVTGLQTFLPHNTLSSWGWHNSSLPTTQNQTLPEDYTGVDWWTHERLVNYEMPNPEQKEISQWMIANPHRINLGRVGLWFGGRNVTEESLSGKTQTLDFWSGEILSEFAFDDEKVGVTTVGSPETDTVAVRITSKLLTQGNFGVVFDFPYASGKNKFDAPFVGLFNATSNHTTALSVGDNRAVITHTLDATAYTAEIAWEGNATLTRLIDGEHKYALKSGKEAGTLSFTVTYAQHAKNDLCASFDGVQKASKAWWGDYWSSGAFISLPFATNSSANELQRRIVLSQYLLAVNGAGKDPAQESGLVNNGWYGKFHLEMVFWHLAHWMFWSKWDLYNRSIGVYSRFLPSSITRAQKQGYEGARLGKMSDPSGRSAPGQINSLLIWQQPHPMYFAEMEYRSFPTAATLQKWDHVLEPVADFMASYAFFNSTTGVYDLGPPLYPVSENTPPNGTMNPTFELSYWRFGLAVASAWKARQHKPVPASWTHVHDNLAPFPVENDAYVTYEGIRDMWTTPEYTEDHPGLLGICGWLPPDPRFNETVFNNTFDKVHETWNFPFSYGWDFPLLAISEARRGDAERAVSWLLDENNRVDELGMPEGGTRVPTPYFPSAAGLLLAVGMMSGGWDGREGGVWPVGWEVEAEGFVRGM